MRTAPTRGCRQAAGLAAAWALCGAATAAPPAPAPAPRQGAVVQYEERRGSSILYFEERGGMAKQPAAPADKREEAASRDAPAPAKTPQAPAKAVAVAARK
jgi:hypothetical protein